jgi:hypothetical protein
MWKKGSIPDVVQKKKSESNSTLHILRVSSHHKI